MVSKSLPMMTIVTVVLNDKRGLIDSRNSLELQNYTNWIHIIVDGKSSDGTIEYARELPSKNTKLISEEDEGIYFAMNKGWAHAPEESIVFFLNAGDKFAFPFSLRVCAKKFLDEKNVWGCTTHEEFDPSQNSSYSKLVAEPNPRNQLYAIGYRSHQAVVFRKSLMQELNGFDTNYQIAADWDLIVRAMRISKPTEWAVPLAQFSLGGISSQKIKLAHEELAILRRIHLKPNPYERIIDYLYRSIWLDPKLRLTKMSSLVLFISKKLEILFRNSKQSQKETKVSRRSTVQKHLEAQKTYLLPFLWYLMKIVATFAVRVLSKMTRNSNKDFLRQSRITRLYFNNRLHGLRILYSWLNRIIWRIERRKFILLPIMLRFAYQLLDILTITTQLRVLKALIKKLIRTSLKIESNKSLYEIYVKDQSDMERCINK